MRTLPPLPMTTLLVTTAVGVDLLAWNGDVVTAAGPALPSWAPVLATIAVHQSLWWRRSRAAPVFAGQAAFALVSLGVPLWQPVAGLLVATYAAGARGLRVTPVALALATVALGHGWGVARSASAPLPALLTVAVLTGLLAGIGYAAGRRQWGAGRRAMAAHAAYQQAVEDTRRAALEDERLRIARELHDVVAHHVSVIGVQAGAARRVLERDPSRLDDARAALGEIETSSREAVGQMRGLLGALRTGADGALEQEQAPRSDQPRDPALSPVETDSRTSSPGVEELAELVTASASASLTTTYTLVESPSAAVEHLPTAVSRSLYRVAQESLANVRRHSTATKVTVVLRVDQVATGGYAELEVTDDGRPRSGTSGSGLGQLGIRERVAMHRGEADIGPRVAGGYRVRVRLPLTAAAS